MVVFAKPYVTVSPDQAYLAARFGPRAAGAGEAFDQKTHEQLLAKSAVGVLKI